VKENDFVWKMYKILSAKASQANDKLRIKYICFTL